MGLIWVHLSLWPIVIRIVLIRLEFFVNEINYISVYGVPVDQETVVSGCVLSFQWRVKLSVECVNDTSVDDRFVKAAICGNVLKIADHAHT